MTDPNYRGSLVTVTTFDTPGGTVTSERVINMKRSESRAWLNKHITWATGQGHGVQCEPLQGAAS